MAARYQHLSPVFLADAVARLDVSYGLPVFAEPPMLTQSTGHENMAATAEGCYRHFGIGKRLGLKL